ncbi:MAG: U32 family peptidase [Clostridia bacterium]|nr:U32 family peptidase [Clostridia bacterium]
MEKTPKLLAPAGSMAALKAAIDAGADEVYLGGSAFNARINASNFDNDALIKAGRLCKSANVGMHITLNTLIYDKEFKSVLEYVDFLANEVNPDALIIQDLGLVSAIRQKFPSLALHASTQMRIHSYLDAEYLKSLGFTRAVLARELPIEDIKRFAESGLETEIFVHGAICVSESGGCLMSSVIGNRSGNRGECAQPCRLPYKAQNKYPLSLKDMCLAPHISELCESGVKSLKIEGRMKAPDYVGAVVSVYRRLLDERRNATGEEIKYLASVFSRSGFTDGYFTSRIRGDMFGIRSESDKKKSESVSGNIKKAEPRSERERVAVPPFTPPERNSEKTLHPALQKGLVLRFEGNPPSAELLAKHGETAARIDIPLRYCADKRFLPYAEKISAIIPRSVFLKELETVKRQIAEAKAAGIKNATVSSFNHLTLCEGMYLHGDYAFNVFNRETLFMLENYSLSSVMLSPETDGRFARGSRCALEYIGYGRMPLMYTRTCIIANIDGCKKQKRCFSRLVDRTGAAFPVISGHSHTNTVYNSLPRYCLDKKSELKKSGVGLLTLLFTTENEKQINEIIGLALSGEKPKFEYTRR